MECRFNAWLFRDCTRIFSPLTLCVIKFTSRIISIQCPQGNYTRSQEYTHGHCKGTCFSILKITVKVGTSLISTVNCAGDGEGEGLRMLDSPIQGLACTFLATFYSELCPKIKLEHICLEGIFRELGFIKDNCSPFILERLRVLGAPVIKYSTYQYWCRGIYTTNSSMPGILEFGLFMEEVLVNSTLDISCSYCI